MNKSAAHSRLVNEIMLALGARPDVTLWKNATGRARALNCPDRIISFGLPGSPDIIGFIHGTGQFIGIEVKTGMGKQSKQQRNFEKQLESSGGVYYVARSVELAKRFIDRVT